MCVLRQHLVSYCWEAADVLNRESGGQALWILVRQPSWGVLCKKTLIQVGWVSKPKSAKNHQQKQIQVIVHKVRMEHPTFTGFDSITISYGKKLLKHVPPNFGNFDEQLFSGSGGPWVGSPWRLLSLLRNPWVGNPIADTLNKPCPSYRWLINLFPSKNLTNRCPTWRHLKPFR